MLYKLKKTGDKFVAMDPVPFVSVTLERELEDLLAQNLWDVLFETSELMTIFQERALQPEADIYALNEQGDLVIFELKKAHAHAGAVHQALRYCEQAGRWRYDELERRLRNYRHNDTLSLQEEHQTEFQLEHQLDKSKFNARQQLVIVGSALDDELSKNVDYWKSKGLSLDFIPYRVYQIAGDDYFEFFSLPYDMHSNPAQVRGVIFDTSKSYSSESIWYMCEGNRVAAFGGIKGIIHSLNQKDLVFLYHKGKGIIAAGEVKSEVKEDKDKDALYRDINWLTTVPEYGKASKSMSASEVERVMGFGFFWAKTMKPPFLTKEQAMKLLGELKKVLD
jgi:hypothetical protein